MFRNRFTLFCAASLLVACAPSRPEVPAGQLGLVMDFTAFNAGECNVVGPGITVDKQTILRGDYFKVVGDINRSTIRCDLPSGTVISTSHRELFDLAQYDYGALIVGQIRGPGEVQVTGYNDGPAGKVDLNGTFVFVRSQ